MAVANTDTDKTDTLAGSSPKAGVVMAILFFLFFLGNSDNQMISPLLPLIAAEFNLEKGAVGGLIIPAYALAAATAAFLVGPISDKFGRRRFLLYASIVFGFSELMIFFVSSFPALVLMRVFTGLASGTFSTCSIAYVADYFPYKRRGVAMSVVQAGYFAALVFGVLVASLLAQWQRNYHASFGFFGALAVAAFLSVLLLLPEDKHAMAEQNLSSRVARRFDNLRVVFESRQRIASIISAFFVSAGFVGFFSYLGSWLTDHFGLKTSETGLFFPLVGIASLVGVLIAGPIADKFGKRWLSILSTIVLALMLLLIPRFGWNVFLFASFLTASLAFAFRQGPLQALATALAPRRARGALVAVRNTASQIGIAVTASVSGYLYDARGYAAVGLFSAVMTLAAAACIFMMKEPLVSEDEH